MSAGQDTSGREASLLCVDRANIGKAGAVADLPVRFLEGVFGAVPIDIGRLRPSEEGAQIEKMLLRRRPLSTRSSSPAGNELFRRHLWALRDAFARSR
jgi:hypothetical protein